MPSTLDCVALTTGVSICALALGSGVFALPKVIRSLVNTMLFPLAVLALAVAISFDWLLHALLLWASSVLALLLFRRFSFAGAALCFIAAVSTVGFVVYSVPFHMTDVVGTLESNRGFATVLIPVGEFRVDAVRLTEWGGLLEGGTATATQLGVVAVPVLVSGRYCAAKKLVLDSSQTRNANLALMAVVNRDCVLENIALQCHSRSSLCLYAVRGTIVRNVTLLFDGGQHIRLPEGPLESSTDGGSVECYQGALLDQAEEYSSQLPLFSVLLEYAPGLFDNVLWFGDIAWQRFLMPLATLLYFTTSTTMNAAGAALVLAAGATRNTSRAVVCGLTAGAGFTQDDGAFGQTVGSAAGCRTISDHAGYALLRDLVFTATQFVWATGVPSVVNVLLDVFAWDWWATSTFAQQLYSVFIFIAYPPLFWVPTVLRTAAQISYWVFGAALSFYVFSIWTFIQVQCYVTAVISDIGGRSALVAADSVSVAFVVLVHFWGLYSTCSIHSHVMVCIIQTALISLSLWKDAAQKLNAVSSRWFAVLSVPSIIASVLAQEASSIARYTLWHVVAFVTVIGFSLIPFASTLSSVALQLFLPFQSTQCALRFFGRQDDYFVFFVLFGVRTILATVLQLVVGNTVSALIWECTKAIALIFVAAAVLLLVRKLKKGDDRKSGPAQ